MSELLPCPGCKAAGLICPVAPFGEAHQVACPICGMRGPLEASDKGAAEAWNALPSHSPVSCGRCGEMERALGAAEGYLLNAKIDLETGATKKTAIATIEGGLRMIRAARTGKDD